MDVEGRFRRRLKQLIEQKYRSLDRFYLETDFSKGHLSEILRGKGSPTLATLSKLARVLDVEVRSFFTFPDRGSRDRAIDLIETAKLDDVRRILRALPSESDEP